MATQESSRRLKGKQPHPSPEGGRLDGSRNVFDPNDETPRERLLYGSRPISPPLGGGVGGGVVFVTGSLYDNASGPYTALKSTVSALVEAGTSVQVLGSKDRPDQLDQTPGWASKSVYALPKVGPYSLHYTPQISNHLKRMQFDLGHFQSVWLWNCAAAARHCFRKKIPYIVTLHGNLNPAALRMSKLKKWVAFQWFVEEYLQNAACLHALNEQEYRAIRAFGLKQPVCIIPNGVDLPSQIVHRPSSVASKKTLLYLARLHPIKNLEGLISAWEMLPQPHRDQWQLIIAGDGEARYKAFLQRLVAEKKLSESIDFVGFITESAKGDRLANADAFILPSHSEGLPMGPLEAMAYGLPCLLSRPCNLPEVVQARAGIDFDTTPEAIARALTHFFDLPATEQQALGQRGRILVEQKFSWQQVATQLICVYDWMLGRGQTPDNLHFN